MSRPEDRSVFADDERVSWQAAWRKGLAVAANNRVLLALVMLAVVCERAVSYFSPWTGTNWKELIKFTTTLAERWTHKTEYMDMILSSAESHVALLGGLLMFLGMLILIGVVTLIRDLFLDGHYEASRVMHQGIRYFWSIVKFKLPIYTLGSLATVLIFGTLWSQHEAGSTTFWIAGVLHSLLWLTGFAIARVFLSLGPKIIVTEQPHRIRAVYRRVLNLVRTQIGSVVAFYLILLAVTAAAVLAAWGCLYLPAPAPVRIAGSVVILAAATLTMKAATFDLYLQLADLLKTANTASNLAQRMVITGPPRAPHTKQADITD